MGNQAGGEVLKAYVFFLITFVFDDLDLVCERTPELLFFIYSTRRQKRSFITAFWPCDFVKKKGPDLQTS